MEEWMYSKARRSSYDTTLFNTKLKRKPFALLKNFKTTKQQKQRGSAQHGKQIQTD